MTIFGIDVSHYQRGINFRTAYSEGIRYVIASTGDGTFKDPQYQTHIQAAEEAGMWTAAYHYMRNPNEGTTIAQQVAASITAMGDKPRPIWLDIETEAGMHVDHIVETRRLYEHHGVPVLGVYTGRYYWEGRVAPSEPDTHQFGAVWVAGYGANQPGRPATIYPGDDHPTWNYPLGNQTPKLWQFGSRAHVAGYEVDINAFRGGIDDLRHLLSGAIRPLTTPTPEVNMDSRVLDFNKDQIRQDTYYNCGPASVQTVVRATTGTLLSEGQLGRELGTHTGGTDYIGQFPRVLNKHLPGARYTHRDIPNDPPTQVQKEQLWQDIRRSVGNGFGVVANIVAPPSNYPRAVAPSTVSPAYRGGTVYHYIAVLGYAEDPAGRRVWVADSGFSPFEYWLSLDQLATLIPPKGYAFHDGDIPKQKPMEETMALLTGESAGALNEAKLAAIAANEKAGRLEARVNELVKKNDEILRNTVLIMDQLVGPGRDAKGWTFTGWQAGGGRTLYNVCAELLNHVKTQRG